MGLYWDPYFWKLSIESMIGILIWIPRILIRDCMSRSLNSLKGVIEGILQGITTGDFDYSS